MTGAEPKIGLMLRLPAWLRDQVAAEAKREGRSLNGQIVQTLILAASTQQAQSVPAPRRVK